MQHRESFRTDGVQQSIGPFHFSAKGVLLINRTSIDAQFFDDAGFEYDAPAHVAATYPLAVPTTRLRGGTITPIPADDPGSLSATVTDAETILSTAQLSTIKLNPPTGVLDTARLQLSGTPVAIATATSTALSLVAGYDWNTDSTIFGNRAGAGSGFGVLKHGVYRASTWINWALSGVGDRYIFIRRNLTFATQIEETRTPTAGLQGLQPLTGLLVLNAGDLIEVVVYQSSGANLNVNGGWVALERITQ